MRFNVTAVCLSALMAAPAGADVMVVRSVENGGIAGYGAAKKNMTTWIAGDRHREETKGEGKPSMMERMSGAGRPVITRLDKKVRWTLNDPKKAYQETPLVAPVAESKKEEPSASQTDDRNQPEEKPTMKITKAELKVKPLEQRKRIGEFTCDGFEMRTVLEMEDLETHKRSELRTITTLWNAPESGMVAQLKKEEEEAYAKAYSQALGMTDAMKSDLKNLGTTMMALMAGAGEKELTAALSKAPAELKKITGYPIVTHVELYSNSDEADEAAAGSDEGVDTENLPSDFAGALNGLAIGMTKKQMASKKPVPTAEGRLMMAMTTQIKSIETGSVPGATFEVPAGYKQVR